MNIIAIDLGGTRIRTALIDGEGNFLHRSERPTLAQEGPEAVIARINESIRRVLNHGPAQAIAISCPGPIDPWRGVVHQAPNLPGWQDVPLASLLNDSFGIPVYLDHDATLAALGEHRFGAGRGFSDLVYMTISTGIGGGIISQGKLIRGWRGMAGEVGHIPLEPEGPICGCGNRGCLEALAAGPAIARQARERIQTIAKTRILDVAGGDPEKITARTVAQAAEGGDALAQGIMNRTGFYIGLGVATLLNILNPQAVILGGGVTQSLPLFQEALEAAVKAHTLPSILQGTKILPAALGDDSGLFGALVLALQQATSR